MLGHITDSTAPGGLRLADDLPEPAPDRHEAVVEVRAYAINPGEALLIRDRPDGFRPGQDVAGVVVRAAADGTGPAVGARVVALLDWAGWAERVAVPTARLAELPDAVGFEPAATLPIAGLVALRGLRQGGLLLGRRVLVTGATGGVGQFAVQLAAAAGAHVTALVRSPDRVADARQCGAHEVRTTLGEGEPFDLVLDGVGGPGLAEAVRRLVPEGTAVLYSSAGGGTELRLGDFWHSGAHNARIVGFFGTELAGSHSADLRLLADLVAQGRLSPRIGRVDDWRRTTDAFAALAAREFRGKAVLTVG